MTYRRLHHVMLTLLIVLGFAAHVLPSPAMAQEICEPAAPPAEVRADMAVSLKRMEAELRRCQATASCTPETITWFGMTRVTGYVLDPASRDILLIGTKAPAAVPLRVDSLAVALRSAVHKYAERRRTAQGEVLIVRNPGVTIDPDPAVMHRLAQIMAKPTKDLGALERRLQEWCATCELPQEVRLLGLGGDAASHSGYTMFSADLLLKSITNGSAPVSGLDSLDKLTMQVTIDQVMQRRGGVTPRAQLNRFWFLSGKTTYLEDDNATVLTRADVLLRTEAEQVRGRHITGTGTVDPLAHRFVCDFTRLFPKLTETDTPHPIFAELENVFRWVALARIMADGSAFEATGYRPDFLIDGLAVPRVEVPDTVKGVARVSRWDHVEENGQTRSTVQVRLPSCGGVTVGLPRERMTVLTDTDQQLPRVKRAVVAARPAQPAIWWALKM